MCRKINLDFNLNPLNQFIRINQESYSIFYNYNIKKTFLCFKEYENYRYHFDEIKIYIFDENFHIENIKNLGFNLSSWFQVKMQITNDYFIALNYPVLHFYDLSIYCVAKIKTNYKESCEDNPIINCQICTDP